MRLEIFSKNRDETGRDENLVSSRREICRDYEVFKLYRATIGQNRSNFCYFWPVLANEMGIWLKSFIFRIFYF